MAASAGRRLTGHPTLRKILCGGEALPRDLADRLLAPEAPVSVWNMYGPTETTVWSTAWEVAARAEEDGILIGTPIDRTQVYVLDENLSPVPLGFPGELCIGGAGVARGYRNRLRGAGFILRSKAHRPAPRLGRHCPPTPASAAGPARP